MAIHCGECGTRVASRDALARHFRRAHRHTQGRVRSRAVQTRPRVLQGEIVDSTLSRTEIVRATRPVAPPRPLQAETRIVRVGAEPRIAEVLSGERPPRLWEPQAEESWRRIAWAGFSPEYRQQLLAERAGAAFSIRPAEMPDQVVLWSQYHALKALAVRLDARIGTERELVAFEAGLQEYNANYDRIRRQRKALPR